MGYGSDAYDGMTSLMSQEISIHRWQTHNAATVLEILAHEFADHLQSAMVELRPERGEHAVARLPSVLQRGLAAGGAPTITRDAGFQQTAASDPNFPGLDFKTEVTSNGGSVWVLEDGADVGSWYRTPLPIRRSLLLLTGTRSRQARSRACLWRTAGSATDWPPHVEIDHGLVPTPFTIPMISLMMAGRGRHVGMPSPDPGLASPDVTVVHVLQDGIEFTGEVEQSVNVSNPGTGTVELRLVVVKPDGVKAAASPSDRPPR